MDEFAQLGRLDAIFEGVTYVRSFGLRLLAILQSPSQLRTNYSVEGARTFEQSFDCSVFYKPSPRDLETQSCWLTAITLSSRIDSSVLLPLVTRCLM